MINRRPAHPSVPLPDLLKAFEPVRRIAETLPGVEIGMAHGRPAVRVRGKFMASIKEDGESMALRMDLESRALLLKLQPEVFYITDHFRDYPGVLVRLHAVGPKQLKEILTDAWALVAPPSLKGAPRVTRKRKPAR